MIGVLEPAGRGPAPGPAHARGTPWPPASSLRLSLLLMVWTCLGAADAASGSGSTAGAESTRVVLLGTGTPNPDPERAGPAVAVVSGGRAYLFDCGTGIVRRAAAAARRGIPALAAANLGIVFLTHLHSDHTLGLADLLLTPWVMERRTPLEVYGPPGTRALVDRLLEAYADDVRIRLEGLEPDKHDGWRAVVHEIAPGVAYRDRHVTVKAFAVPHANYEPGRALGYRIETADRAIVISGDTRPSDAVVEHCAGCDVLVHEVYSARGFRNRTPEWQRYHADAHTSTDELAALASRARPNLLVLYHQLFMGTAEDSLVQEVRRGYPGAVVSGGDLDVF
jgi:ribonuclease BN (tRNA processing enzyme)